MRIVHIVTALCVAFVLFALVLKRDTVFALVGRPPANTEMVADEVAETPESEILENRAVGVVAISSVASSIDTGITLRGLTEAARSVEVRAETSGLMIVEPLRKGSLVVKGQLLCELDPGTRFIALAEAKARLREAELNELAATRLANEGFVSETNKSSALAALQAATTAVERAEQEIDRLKLFAPFDGLLESDGAELGSLLQPGSLCTKIIQIDPIRIVGFITEAEVDLVTEGDNADIRLISGRELQGRVTFISKVSDLETRTFRIEVTVANPDLSIRDGSTAEILISAEPQLAHLIPQSALTLNDNGQLGVQTVEGTTAAFVPVEVIRDTVDGVWISGLAENTDIIVVGHEYVIDGSSIRVSYRGS